MAFSHISQYEYKSTNYLFISTTNRLLLIPLTMNADNHDELNIQQSITGLTVATKKRKKYLDLNERIIRAVQNYGRVSNIMFCKCISNLV